jgi:putative addiction module killer protein
VIEVRQTEIFARWLANLRDGRARARINARIRRLSVGNPGDVKSVGSGVSEIRIDYGPGYRVYFVRRGEALVILVAGGDKRTPNLHRVRSRLITERTAVINQIRGFLLEHGIPVRHGLRGWAGRWRFAPLMRPLEL